MTKRKTIHITDLLPSRVARHLETSGVGTVKKFLAALEKEGADDMGARIGVNAKSLNVFADQCRLAQLDGIKPDQVRLLIAVGLGSMRAIASLTDPHTTGLRLSHYNRVNDTAKNVPTPAQLTAWRDEAYERIREHEA